MMLLHVFSTFNIAGPQVRFCDFANHFGARYTHLIIAMDNNYEAFQRINFGVSAKKVEITCHKSQTLKNILLFRKRLNEINPDLLITYNWGAIEWVMANAISSVCPSVHVEDGFNDDEVNGQKWHRVLFRRLLLQAVNQVVVPSLTLSSIARNSWCVSPDRLTYIPNGIEICENDINTKNNDQEKLHVTIGTVARIRQVKNLSRLIRVFKKIPSRYNVRLSIVGDGPSLPNLIREAKGSDNIFFQGYQSDPSVFIRDMDIFAITSDSEQMPIALIEAMALGKTIVSTDVGDIKEVVSEVNKSFIVPINEEDTMCSKLIELIENSKLREELGVANKIKCSVFYSKQKMLDSYDQVFHNAICVR